MLCLSELLCNLLPGEKRGVAGGGHNGVVGAHAAVGVVGREEGREQRNIEIAKKMLAAGMDIDTIMKMTDLSKSEIEKL